jgi:hypothetical protein
MITLWALSAIPELRAGLCAGAAFGMTAATKKTAAATRVAAAVFLFGPDQKPTVRVALIVRGAPIWTLGGLP